MDTIWNFSAKYLLLFTGLSPKAGRISFRIGPVVSSSTSDVDSVAVDSSAEDSSAGRSPTDSSRETSKVKLSAQPCIPEVDGTASSGATSEEPTSVDTEADANFFGFGRVVSVMRQF